MVHSHDMTPALLHDMTWGDVTCHDMTCSHLLRKMTSQAYYLPKLREDICNSGSPLPPYQSDEPDKPPFQVTLFHYSLHGPIMESLPMSSPRSTSSSEWERRIRWTYPPSSLECWCWEDRHLHHTRLHDREDQNWRNYQFVKKAESAYGPDSS